MHSRNSYFLLLVIALTGLSAWLFTVKPAQMGLDVNGGARFTYQMVGLTQEQQAQIGQVRSKLQHILTSRVSQSLGVVEGNVQSKGEDQFVVELPGFTDVEEARQTLSTTAKLICYHAKNVSTEKVPTRPYEKAGGSASQKEPLERFVRRTDPENVLEPGAPGYAQMIEGWDKILEGQDLSDAIVEVQGKSARPLFKFSADGARKLEAWCRKYRNRGENIAFVLDGKVLSIAPLKEGTILTDNAVIDGQFDTAYVKQLTDLLKAGALPVELKELSSERVDPTIGKHAFSQMVTSGIIAVASVCLFLVVYYGLPGLVAMVALMLYVLFTLTVMRLAGATFSLAAVAAFVLSVATAVDANVLVFERVKEELRTGKALLTSVELGFKRAFTAIVDSNACSIITSVVLWYFGTGAVKGFATTLIIGVVVSFFTAITVTRSLLLGAMSMGWFADPKFFALERNWFGEHLEQKAHSEPLKIIEHTKLYFLISGLIIVPGILFAALGGIKPNVEFQGGFEGMYLLKQGSQLTADSVRENLEKSGLEGANVKMATGSEGKVVYVTVPANAIKKLNIEAEPILNQAPQAPAATGTDPAPAASAPVSEDASAMAVNKAVSQAAGFALEDSRGFRSVGPTVQKEMVRNACYGVIVSSLLIVLYLAIRFGIALGGVKSGLKFGFSAVLALIHDVFVVVGCAAILGFFLGWEISALFITSLLTVIGFSVHDTIVIFDRIRENLRRPRKGEKFEHLANRSVTQSIARSINTSFTAILSLIILIAVGTPTPELKFMCLTMLIGLIIGTYSSIFNATPILNIWNNIVMKKQGEQAGLLAEAAREAKVQATMAAPVDMPTAQPGPKQAGYGTIKRRSSVIEKSTRPVDEDEE